MEFVIGKSGAFITTAHKSLVCFYSYDIKEFNLCLSKLSFQILFTSFTQIIRAIKMSIVNSMEYLKLYG